MDDIDLQALLPALEGFHARFGRFFRRSEGRAFGRQYLIGLTLPIERKNAENIAEQVGAPPRKLQEFLSESPWDDEGCIGELQRFVGEQFGAPDGVLILDDTGFAKKGIHSAGVGRQYSGTLGRVDNCQVGVFLGYASRHGHTLVDRRLYLTEGWLTDPAKRRSPRVSCSTAIPRPTSRWWAISARHWLPTRTERWCSWSRRLQVRRSWRNWTSASPPSRARS